jgi:hypothetical protein
MRLWADRRSLVERLSPTVGVADLLGVCTDARITSERTMLRELLRRAGMSRVGRIDARVLAASVVAISNAEMRALSWLLTHAVQRGRELLLRHRRELLAAHAAESSKKGRGIGAVLFRATAVRSHVISLAQFVALLRALPEKLTTEVSRGAVSALSRRATPRFPSATANPTLHARARSTHRASACTLGHCAAGRLGCARSLHAAFCGLPRPTAGTGPSRSVALCILHATCMIHAVRLAVQEEAILLDWLPADSNGTFDLAALLTGLRVISVLDSAAPIDDRVGALFCAHRSRLLQLCLAHDPACTGAIPTPAFHAVFASACADVPADVASAVLARVAPAGAEITMYAWLLNSFVILSTHLGVGEAAAAAAIAGGTQVGNKTTTLRPSRAQAHAHSLRAALHHACTLSMLRPALSSARPRAPDASLRACRRRAAFSCGTAARSSARAPRSTRR